MISLGRKLLARLFFLQKGRRKECSGGMSMHNTVHCAIPKKNITKQTLGMLWQREAIEILNKKVVTCSSRSQKGSILPTCRMCIEKIRESVLRKNMV